MSIAYNNRATDMILTAFQGVAFNAYSIIINHYYLCL